MVKTYLTILALFFSVMPLTFAWNANGHRMVAQIAYLELDVQTRQQVDVLLNGQFIEDSTWADRARAHDETMNTWHYINLPHPSKQKNVVDAINDAMAVLKNPKANKSEQALALRGLIHWVADVHQPLHTIGRDRGGTLFPLAKNPDGKSLHQYWDNGGGVLKKVSPMKTTAALWMKKYPPSKAQLQEMDVMQWAEDAYLVATTQAYVGIKPNTVPDAAYREKTQRITEQQIVLAGYRLAYLLNQ